MSFHTRDEDDNDTVQPGSREARQSIARSKERTRSRIETSFDRQARDRASDDRERTKTKTTTITQLTVNEARKLAPNQVGEAFRADKISRANAMAALSGLGFGTQSISILRGTATSSDPRFFGDPVEPEPPTDPEPKDPRPIASPELEDFIQGFMKQFSAGTSGSPSAPPKQQSFAEFQQSLGFAISGLKAITDVKSPYDIPPRGGYSPENFGAPISINEVPVAKIMLKREQLALAHLNPLGDALTAQQPTAGI